MYEEDVKYWKTKLNYYSHKNFTNPLLDYKFYDLRPLYKSFVKKEINEDNEDKTLQFPSDMSTICIACFKTLKLLSDFPNVDVSYIKTSQICTDERYIFDMCDAFCDLKVSGASFARLTFSCLNGNPIELTKDNQGDFVLPEITIETPIFTTHKIILETDGNIIYYTFIMISLKRNLYYTFKNSYAVSWLPNKNIIMAGYCWMPNFIANENEFIKIEPMFQKIFFIIKNLRKLNYKIIFKLIKFINKKNKYESN